MTNYELTKKKKYKRSSVTISIQLDLLYITHFLRIIHHKTATKTFTYFYIAFPCNCSTRKDFHRHIYLTVATAVTVYNVCVCCGNPFPFSHSLNTHQAFCLDQWHFGGHVTSLCTEIHTGVGGYHHTHTPPSLFFFFLLFFLLSVAPLNFSLIFFFFNFVAVAADAVAALFGLLSLFTIS